MNNDSTCEKNELHKLKQEYNFKQFTGGTFFDFVASKGNLSILQYLYNNPDKNRLVNNTLFTTWAMDWASLYGHLNVLKFLHSIGANCTHKAMNFASMNGHLKIVKWLNENRIEVGTKDALEEAFFNGHLEVIKYLLLNPITTFKLNGHEINIAIENKHKHIIDWYIENIADSFIEIFIIKCKCIKLFN